MTHKERETHKIITRILEATDEIKNAEREIKRLTRKLKLRPIANPQPK